jgi:hypothetical protein
MKCKTFSLFILVVLFTSMALTACAAQPQPVSDDIKTTITAAVEPETDNLLAAIAANDYKAFTKDMAPKMVKALTETSFSQIVSMFTDKLGKVQSRQITSITQIDTFYTVMYKLKCEKAPKVTMRVVVDNAAPYQISGLWFDAPELH